MTNEPRKGDWIQTFTGKAFWPLDPQPSEIDIEDIAHALSNSCRFTGHVKKFYSVAEHSIHVSRICAPEDALWGLLHDASEAYICDIARPVKLLPFMDGYREVEGCLMGHLVKRFGLPLEQPDSVTVADKVMLAIEARDLMGTLRPGWEKWLDMIPEGFELNVRCPLDPPVAKYRFLERFRELGGSNAR
jgi:hypothetical protein